MARDATTRRRLLAGCASVGTVLLAGCSASGDSGTTDETDADTTVAPTEATVAFGADGRVDLNAVENGESQQVEVAVVDADGEPVTADGITVTVDPDTATLDGSIVRQVTEESVTITFDGSHGLGLPEGQSEGTLAVGIVAPPESNVVDDESNPEITVTN